MLDSRGNAVKAGDEVLIRGRVERITGVYDAHCDIVLDVPGEVKAIRLETAQVIGLSLPNLSLASEQSGVDNSGTKDQ